MFFKLNESDMTEMAKRGITFFADMVWLNGNSTEHDYNKLKAHGYIVWR